MTAPLPTPPPPASQANEGPPRVCLSPSGGGLGIARPWGRSERTWRLTRVGQYLYAEWDGQSVLYHTGSGDTRWISVLARLALEQLEAGPRRFAELNAALRPVVAEADHDWLEEALGETLQELSELDLLERA